MFKKPMLKRCNTCMITLSAVLTSNAVNCADHARSLEPVSLFASQSAKVITASHTPHSEMGMLFIAGNLHTPQLNSIKPSSVKTHSVSSTLEWQSNSFSTGLGVTQYRHIVEHPQWIFDDEGRIPDQYAADISTYIKNKNMMIQLGYDLIGNSDIFGTNQAGNVKANISFYNPYHHFSRVNLNYKKSTVGLEMSQLGLGLTFYGDVNFTIISLLDVDDIQNSQLPKKLNFGFGISHQL